MLVHRLTPDEIIAYRYGGNFDGFGGVAPKAVYSGEGVEGKKLREALSKGYMKEI